MSESSAAGLDRPVVAVANRLPLQRGEDGWQLSPGGLVTALRPVMSTHPGAWVGWDGGTKGMPPTLPDSGVRLVPIGLSATQVRNYYHGFANATMWPLLHDAIEKPRFERAWWFAYQDVNTIFADRALTALDDLPGALAWVHDYHMMLVPQLIRSRLADQPIGFFLHVPWPSPGIFARLPWREQVLAGLLGADVVAFHTDEYRGNFIRSCARLLARAQVWRSGARRWSCPTAAWWRPPPRRSPSTPQSSPGTPPTRRQARTSRPWPNSSAAVPCCSAPTGWTTPRGSSSGCWRWRCCWSGIPSSGPASRSSRSPCRAGTTCGSTASCAAPSSSTSAGSTAGSPSRAATSPCTTSTRGLSQQQLAAYYAQADALLVTPLIDGMNLVCKEYVTVQEARGGSGVLVLSEFTGAAVELPQAVLCNPFDVEGLSYRIEHALRLPADDRRKALAAMAEHVRIHDVHRWVSDQLAASPPAASPPDGHS